VALSGQDRRATRIVDNGKFKVLVIGDSMAGNVVNLFGESGIVDEIDLATQHTSYLCQPVLPADPLTFAKVAPPESYCGILAESVKRSDKLPAADVIVLAGFWQGWAIELIPETIRFLRTVSSARVAVIGVKQSNSGGLQFLAENARNPNLRSYMIRYDQWVLDANRRMEALSKAEGAEFYDLHALYCNSVGCPFMTPNGDIIVYDHAHYTQAGAAWIATRIRAEWSIRLFHPKGPSEPAMRVEFPPAPVVR
jgi:hypothetical protein